MVSESSNNMNKVDLLLCFVLLHWGCGGEEGEEGGLLQRSFDALSLHLHVPSLAKHKFKSRLKRLI